MPDTPVLPFLKSFLSQWHRSDFELDGLKFCCAEQYMMYRKAQLFGDATIAEKIMSKSDPHDHKRLGQQVKNFDHDTWEAHKSEIAFTGNMAKFSQNAGLKKKLLATGNALLAEANVKDFIWGIGSSEDDPRVTDPSAWLGPNLLGEVLMKVREKLSAENAE